MFKPRVFCLFVPVFVAILLSAAVSGCGAAAGVGAVTSNLVGGFAVKGPVAGGSVNIYELLDDGTKGELLGTTITGPEGSFQITVEDYEGPLFLEVVSGAFVDEATGVYTELSEENPLIALVPNYNPEEGLSDLSVTPLTSIAAGLAQSQIAEGADPAEAAETANETIAEYFGLEDILTTPPPDLTDPEEEADEGTDYALIMAGLSTVARDYGVDTMDLIDALAADIADGSFDGQSDGGAIAIGGQELTADVTGSELAAGIEDFVESDMNAAGVTTDDASAVVTSVSGNTGSLPAPWIDSVTPDSAVVGAMVTIHGQNFAEGVRVFFGDVEANGVATGGLAKAFAGEVWYTVLTCTVPAWDDYGVRNIKVENPDGRSAVLGEGFTYLTNPVVGSVSQVLGSVGGGEAVTISGSGFFDGLTVRFGSATATDVVVVNRNTITCTTPTSIGVRASVTVTNPDARADVLADSYTFWNGIRKVDAAAIGGGDGYNWATAFSNFDEAEAAVSATDEIWVAAGTYTNGGGTTDPVLELPEDTFWYGGFTGIETDRSARDFVTNVTILDGQDEAYHVVLGAEGSTLDGFTITNGNAIGTEGHDNSGGGLFGENVTITIANCVFNSNSADHDGGAICLVTDCTVTIYSCEFIGNAAESGGGILLYSNCSGTISDCSFESNTASGDGGAVNLSYGCSPGIAACTFTTNSSTASDGGAISCIESASPAIDNCTFTGNTANDEGGAVYAWISSSPSLDTCTFTSNSAVDGGAALFYEDCTLDISNCTFELNVASDEGGGIYAGDTCGGTITTCYFSANDANTGGAIFLYSYSSPTISNTDFEDNTAAGGGAMLNYEYCSPTITNCDFNYNIVTGTGGGIVNNTNCAATISDCTFTGNEAGDDAGAIANFTISDATISNCSFTSNISATQAGAIFNWNYSDPAFTDCTFTSNSSGEQGGAIYEYTNCAATYSSCTFTSNIGGGDGGAVNLDSGCASSFSLCTFENNTSTGGHAGAIYTNSSSLTLSGCTFDTNEAYYDGGALRNVGATLSISDTTFIDNVTGVWRYGGAIRNDTSTSGTFDDCLFDNNHAMRGGCVASFSNSSPTYNRCTFRNHREKHDGAVLYSHDSDSIVNNCLFINNQGNYGGATFNHNGSRPYFNNCTFAYNTAGRGGAIYNTSSSYPWYRNCIFWGNTCTTDGPDLIRVSGTVYITYSIFPQASQHSNQGGNTTGDPLFVDADGPDDIFGTDDDNCRLQAGSPAVDTASASYAPADDLDSDTRDGAPDRGAYEYKP